MRIGSFPLGSVHFLENLDRPRQESFAMWRQLGLTFHAIKQSLAQLLLEFQDLLTQRRLRHMTLLCRTREIARARHRHHVSKLMHFHRQFLW